MKQLLTIFMISLCSVGAAQTSKPLFSWVKLKSLYNADFGKVNEQLTVWGWNFQSHNTDDPNAESVDYMLKTEDDLTIAGIQLVIDVKTSKVIKVTLGYFDRSLYSSFLNPMIKDGFKRVGTVPTSDGIGTSYIKNKTMVVIGTIVDEGAFFVQILNYEQQSQ